MFILPVMKLILLAVCFAVVWGFISTGQVSLAIAVICMVIISLLTA
jgi:hypothetical protein